MNHLAYACLISTSQTTWTNVSVLLRTVFIANVGKFPSASLVDASCLRCISAIFGNQRAWSFAKE